MSELNKDSTVIELINSKSPLKKLRTILSTRDTTIKEVFNATGYFYEAKLHKWIKLEDGQLDENVTFQVAVEQLKGKSRANRKLIETNNDDVARVTPSKKVANSELIETNSDRNTEVLNALGLTPSKWNVLMEIIDERMLQMENKVDVNEIYNEIAHLKSRKRKNKTFYISEDLTQEVVELAEELNIKISQFVEVALIETLTKYKSTKTIIK